MPEEAFRYLEHTEKGRSIRNLAKQAGCHPSTVLRQVRRLERRRDDPLVDSALSNLAANHYADRARNLGFGPAPLSARSLVHQKTGEGDCESEAAFDTQALEVLTCLNSTGAVLAIADGMEKAVVVREPTAGEIGGTAKKMVIERSFAEALALRDWIAGSGGGRLNRYRITSEGRRALKRIIAACENREKRRREAIGIAGGIAGGSVGRDWVADARDKDGPDAARSRRRRYRARYGLAESPLHMLARLTDQDGVPFLSADLVRAGERLREDFELAQVARHLSVKRQEPYAPIDLLSDPPAVARDLVADAEQEAGDTLTVMPRSRRNRRPGDAAVEAEERANKAFEALGAGLSDIVFRCCCQMEGLEAAEQQLGWSARSGKIVLRIALQQLQLFYAGQAAPDDMIG